MRATTHDHADMIELVLKYGASIDLQDNVSIFHFNYNLNLILHFHSWVIVRCTKHWNTKDFG